MLWLAIKTLFKEKMRFCITLIGITVAGVLALIEIAIYLGMMGNATAVIRHTDADIWIASKNVQSFDFGLPFPAERVHRVRALADVRSADKLLVSWGFIKLANGGREQAQMIGFDPDTGIGRPWAMFEGQPGDVKGGNYMIIDKTAEQRLGRLDIGTQWELSLMNKEHSLKLVGLSQGIKSFTTIPVVFTSYNQLDRLLEDADQHGQTTFIVAKLKDPATASRVVRALSAGMADNDVMTKNEFIRRTVMYWTVQTGMGMAFFLTAALAMIIGGTVVGQTIYASTLEHLREYGTLKAIGARNGEIYQVIFAQAGINAVAGYAISVLVVLLLKGAIEKAGVPFQLSPPLFVALFLAILAACMASAWFSVGKIRRLDPVSVFKA